MTVPGRQDPYRVLVCGSNYGRVYLPAIEATAGRFRADGLLARSSERSRQLAEENGLRHHDSATDLEDRYDIACCALPSNANNLVLELLDRGLHVLCEHPRSPRLLAAAFERAEGDDLAFQINGHFVDLPASDAFVARCLDEGGLGAVRHLEVTCQDRALYAALDIVEAALEPGPGVGLADDDVPDGSAADIGADIDSAPSGREWQSWQTELWGVHTALTVQTPGAADGSRRYRVLYRLTAVFDAGTVTLASPAGPVIWSSNVQHMPSTRGELWQVLTPVTTLAELVRARLDANVRALDRLRAQMEEGTVARLVAPRRTLRVAREWRRLGASVAG